MRETSPRGCELKWSPIDSFAGNFTSPDLIYSRGCPVCGSVQSRPVLSFRQFQFFSDSRQHPKRVDIHQQQCLDCFCLYQNPVYSKKGFEILFAEAGQSYGSTEARPGEQIRWLQDRVLLNDGSTLLDVGCWQGKFLSQLPDSIQKIGVEIDPEAVERARRDPANQGVLFVQGDFDSFAWTETVDTITLFHVLEHLPEPVPALRKLHSLSHSQTRLVVEVPILERGLTNDINGFFSAQHMTHFSRASLESCLSAGGWQSIDDFSASDYNGHRIVAQPLANPRGEPAAALPAERLPGQARLGTQELQNLYRCLAHWRQSLIAVSKRLEPISTQPHCILWGAGLHTEFLYQTMLFFQSDPERRFILVDSDPLKQGKSWRGVPVYPPSVLSKAETGNCPLIISSYGDQESIASAALRQGVAREQLVRLYDELSVY